MKTALITGASSGIGKAFAELFAKDGINTVLVARSEGKLKDIAENLKTTYNIETKVMPMDLSEEDAPQKLYEKLKSDGTDIEFLINNAGFGDYGLFNETNIKKESDMLALNINTLTFTTKLFIKDMIERGSGKIVNVASTGAFQPCPYMAVYCATKSYVLNFSEAIHTEFKKKGVTVTALCPGATDTGFQGNAGADKSKLFKKKIATPEQVASYGYKSMMKGKAVAVHGFKNKLLAFSTRLMPRSVVRCVTKNMMGT